MNRQPPHWQGTYASYRFCGHGPIWSAWQACSHSLGRKSVAERPYCLTPPQKCEEMTASETPK
jgi:hypothetical protein